MRKIDKSQILSTEYKEWEEGLEQDGHPKYQASHRFYQDVKMNLLHAQQGLCAYTEEQLCPEEYIGANNWSEGKYARELTREERAAIQGDIEHFYESKKARNGWQWDNLFVVSTHVNCRIKGSKAVFDTLKPDRDTYDPDTYLTYDTETGIFGVSSSVREEEKEQVEYMIQTLGLNCIADRRKKRIREWLDRKNLGLPVAPNCYVTAWEMASREAEG